MHHICYEVTDLNAAIEQLTAEGMTVLGDGVPSIGAHGLPVVFLHPKDTLGTLVELRGILGERDVLRLTGRFEVSAVEDAFAANEFEAEVVQLDADQLTLALAQASMRLPELFAALTSAGAEVRETTLTQPSLESLFIKLTGRELRE